MEVHYVEIRENVIAKLVEQAGNMETVLTDLSTTVSDIISCNYLKGGTAAAYNTEFVEIIRETFQKINDNISAIADQLESICQQYETLDADLSGQLS